MLKIQKKKNSIQTFNNVAFPKKGYLFYIEKYVFFYEKIIEAKKEDVKIKAN